MPLPSESTHHRLNGALYDIQDPVDKNSFGSYSPIPGPGIPVLWKGFYATYLCMVRSKCKCHFYCSRVTAVSPSPIKSSAIGSCLGLFHKIRFMVLITSRQPFGKSSGAPAQYQNAVSGSKNFGHCVVKSRCAASSIMIVLPPRPI